MEWIPLTKDYPKLELNVGTTFDIVGSARGFTEDP